MPIYQFESKHGHMLERFYHMADAPKIGARIKFRGRVYSRVPSDYQCMAVADRHFVSNMLPRNYAHHAGEFEAGTGKPMFDSKRTLTETLAKSRDLEGSEGYYDYE